MWVQETYGVTYGPFVQDGDHFEWLSGNATLKKWGWDKINGTIGTGGHIDLYYHRPPSSPGQHGLVHDPGAFIDCDHIRLPDSPWHRPGSGPTPPGPRREWRPTHGMRFASAGYDEGSST